MTLSVPSQVNIKPYVSNILLVKSDIIIYTYHGEILSVDKSTLMYVYILSFNFLLLIYFKEILRWLPRRKSLISS